MKDLFLFLFLYTYSALLVYSWKTGRLISYLSNRQPSLLPQHAHISRKEKVIYLPSIHCYKPNGWLSKSRLEFSNETLQKPNLWCPKSPEGYTQDLIIELLVYFQHLLWCRSPELGKWSLKPRIRQFYGSWTCIFLYFLASQCVWWWLSIP